MNPPPLWQAITHNPHWSERLILLQTLTTKENVATFAVKDKQWQQKIFLKVWEDPCSLREMDFFEHTNRTLPLWTFDEAPYHFKAYQWVNGLTLQQIWDQHPQDAQDVLALLNHQEGQYLTDEFKEIKRTGSHTALDLTLQLGLRLSEFLDALHFHGQQTGNLSAENVLIAAPYAKPLIVDFSRPPPGNYGPKDDLHAVQNLLQINWQTFGPHGPFHKNSDAAKTLHWIERMDQEEAAASLWFFSVTSNLRRFRRQFLGSTMASLLERGHTILIPLGLMTVLQLPLPYLLTYLCSMQVYFSWGQQNETQLRRKALLWPHGSGLLLLAVGNFWPIIPWRGSLFLVLNYMYSLMGLYTQYWPSYCPDPRNWNGMKQAQKELFSQWKMAPLYFLSAGVIISGTLLHDSKLLLNLALISVLIILYAHTLRFLFQVFKDRVSDGQT